jgi:hypothetical protein
MEGEAERRFQSAFVGCTMIYPSLCEIISYESEKSGDDWNALGQGYAAPILSLAQRKG